MSVKYKDAVCEAANSRATHLLHQSQYRQPGDTWAIEQTNLHNRIFHITDSPIIQTIRQTDLISVVSHMALSDSREVLILQGATGAKYMVKKKLKIFWIKSI